MMDDERGLEKDLERRIEDMLAQRKNDIEKSLAEAIDQEKEKARQRTLEIEKEFEAGRGALARHQAMVAEASAVAESVREQIGKHIEQAAHCRIMVRHLADKIGEECRNAEELKGQIADLLCKTDEESARLRAELGSRYGLEVPPLPIGIPGGIEADQAESLRELSAYREGLMALDAYANPVPAAAIPGEGGSGPEAEAVTKALESFRTTESLPDVGAFRVYRNEEYAVLDGGSLLDEAVRLIGEARIIHGKLESAGSAKEQYYFKREIIGLQEGLGKLVGKALEICETGSCRLPQASAGILDAAILKDIRDRLATGNWSDPADLSSFEGVVGAVRAALSSKEADWPNYGKAILEQLHASV